MKPKICHPSRTNHLPLATRQERDALATTLSKAPTTTRSKTVPVLPFPKSLVSLMKNINTRGSNNSPDKTTITVGPSGARLPGAITLTPDHPSAITFCVLGPVGRQVILQSSRPHKSIYNALKQCTAETSSRNWRAHLADYDVSIRCGRLTKSILGEFLERYAEAYGFPRYTVVSGRVWPGLNSAETGPFAALAFWNDRGLANDRILALIRAAFRLKSPVFTCRDSDRVCEWKV